MVNTPKIKIALIEDNSHIAEMLVKRLNALENIECKHLYSNAEDALCFLPQHSIDILLVDLGLPGMNGIDFIKQYAQINTDVLICVFTVYEDDDKIFSAIEAGAKGYLLKGTEMSKLGEAILELSDGGSPMSPYIARRVIEKLTKTKTVEYNLPLSDRKLELLKMLAQGYTYKKISELLFLTVGTVKQHVHRIYTKLQVANKTEAINLFNQSNNA